MKSTKNERSHATQTKSHPIFRMIAHTENASLKHVLGVNKSPQHSTARTRMGNTNSKDIHRAYAKSVRVELPPLEDYERYKAKVMTLPKVA